MKRRWLAWPLALATAGCMVGSDYRVPERAVANAPSANGRFVNAGETGLSEEPLPDHWWRLYDDARLDGYVQEALAANTDLRAADANLRRATAAIREAEAGLTVSTTLSGGPLEGHLGGINPYVPSGLSYAFTAGIALPLDLSGGLRRGIEAANADAAATAATRDQVRVTVAAAVARNYVAVCSANRSIDAAKRVATLQARTVDDIERLFQGGRATAFDVSRSRIAVHQTNAAIPPLLAQRQAALYALAALMGRPPADYPKALEACPEPPVIARALPVGDGAALIRRRQDIRAAERRLAAATAGIGVVTADLYPQVSILGNAGFAGPLSSQKDANRFGGTFGPFISWSFPNVAATRARIAEAGAAAEAASARFDGTVLTALEQTESALTAYAREADHNQALRRARDSAFDATRQAATLFRFGRTNVLDLLDVQASLATTETAVASSDALLADRAVGVFLALGGGWQP